MALQMNLPQMSSIWIDEDQEAEKLYGLQVQRLMDSDDDDQVDMMMINSDRPVLNNKERIELPPLMPAAYKPSYSKKPLQNMSSSNASSSSKTKRTTDKLLRFFKGKEPRSGTSGAKISVPFNFQHISHADLKNVFEGEELPCKAPISPVILNRAFVTESSVPFPNTLGRKSSNGSKASSSRRTTSIASSQYSSKSARIVSTSTMATSVHDDSYRSLKKLNQLEKVHLKHRYNKSDASSVSAEFLKNYSFPTVLEDVSLVEVKTPDMSRKGDKFTWESPQNCEALLETMLQSRSPIPSSTCSRRKSDSQLLFSPVVEHRASFLDTPKTRKSVDDVLLCYHQPSEASSEARPSSEFSFSQGSNMVNRTASWDRENETFME
ncbi:LANO_0G06700g1_1 [Lachancea nothofagi CBS 11611]|uniref:LANO_0G06700g1_1 n=1 Tax=Lachancea nothofagi CBS 11611 TaxID=1266666 RepID=A0A1G4KHB1_9SACH|nr:LANO_0G06700g1_1 [Lachancea nothofagi CBS 11611]